MFNIFNKGEPGSIAYFTEHTFSKKNFTQPHSVKTTQQLIVFPDFGAMGISQLMHFMKCFFYFIRDPGPVLSRPDNFLALTNDLRKCFVDRKIKFVSIQ